MPPCGRSARTESEPVVPRRGMAFRARVFPAVTGTSVVPETIGPPAKTERMPAAVGLTTVTFAATEMAVDGMPQRPTTGRTSVCEAPRGIPPAGPVGVARVGDAARGDGVEAERDRDAPELVAGRAVGRGEEDPAAGAGEDVAVATVTQNDVAPAAEPGSEVGDEARPRLGPVAPPELVARDVIRGGEEDLVSPGRERAR